MREKSAKHHGDGRRGVGGVGERSWEANGYTLSTRVNRVKVRKAIRQKVSGVTGL